MLLTSLQCVGLIPTARPASRRSRFPSFSWRLQLCFGNDGSLGDLGHGNAACRVVGRAE
jgi:hypothetical protein